MSQIIDRVVLSPQSDAKALFALTSLKGLTDICVFRVVNEQKWVTKVKNRVCVLVIIVIILLFLLLVIIICINIIILSLTICYHMNCIPSMMSGMYDIEFLMEV